MKKQIYIYDTFIGELLFLANDRQALDLYNETRALGLMGDKVSLLLFENDEERKVYVLCEGLITKAITKTIRQALDTLKKEMAKTIAIKEKESAIRVAKEKQPLLA